ncbi:MAG: DNA internalization-related competence protein ComEC/Rec2, partial [Lachnospiraceae bacterium]|nr:DNA internalization-related competence protein ComEC/Rec2 [Lachnospiraceae bacterium]
ITVFLAIGFMYCYGVMTGMSVSSIRAIMMFGFHVSSELCKRTYDMLTAMTIAAISILIEQPLYLYHSGFLFSFGAILGIGLLAPAVEENGIGHLAPIVKENGIGSRKIIKAIEANLAIAIAVFPVYLYFYYEYPLYSLFLNLLIIPGTVLLVSGGLLSVAGAAYRIFLGKCFALPIGGLLRLYEMCCMFFQQLPGNRSIIGRPAMWQIAIFSFLICFTFICCKRMTKIEFWMYILLAFLCITIRFSDGLQITFLDVGQGDGIYLADGKGGHYLIDGGSSSKNELGEYQLVPFLKATGVDTLDVVFVTHLDDDHYNGIEYLLMEQEHNGICIRRLILPALCENCQDERYNALEKKALQQNVVLQYMDNGDVIRHGNFKLTCLHPNGCKNNNITTNKCEIAKDTTNDGTKNEQSLVLYLEYGNFTALFTGDLEGSGEEEVQKKLKEAGANLRRLTVLKVAHHGSRNSTSQTFLNLTRPEIAVISCGENNRYGHPHAELLERLEAVGAKVMRTDEMGAIEMRVKDDVKVTVYKRTRSRMGYTRIFCLNGIGKWKECLDEK